MVNLKLTIAYEGTDFTGYQRQGQGERTVQGELEKALQKLTGTTPKLIAAGRTDAGVHAKGQVVNFTTQASIPITRWPAALNSCLPTDLIVCQAEAVPLSFHARYGAKSKTYQYIVSRRRWPDLFLRRFSYHYPRSLQLEPLRTAAAFLVGEHDFKGFSAAGSSVVTTVRRLDRVEVAEQGEEIFFTLTGNGFLYKMVRNIVGTLLWIGEGKKEPRLVKAILTEGDRRRAGPTAPPQGLTLLKVEY
ncbi:MAG TPA: tRNA pseudouridine(38-40) synthase TruA [Firmicutes bacterium]|nr:tRNA pseudouridine(38-40) synthase TruA [Bacillota bacterium]